MCSPLNIIEALIRLLDKPVNCFLCGQCLLFAKELQSRIGGELRYLVNEAHVVLHKDGKLYDASGNVTKKYTGCRYLTEQELFSRTKILRELQM